MIGACLGDETIAAMLEGGLGEDAARRVRGHIVGCDACRQLVSAAIDAELATSAPPTTQHALLGSIVGTVIADRYRIERLIGEGGMGRVYAAHQIGLERAVAVKILRPDVAYNAMAMQRFRREARLLAALTSEHVVRVHDFGALDTNELYFVMEMLDGEDLGTIAARGPVDPARAVEWIVAACDALDEAHALGIIHRDIKPSNLFLTNRQRIKVLDFGLAKLKVDASASMTGAGMILGSPYYMAPEQIAGAENADARSDIWALGATLYHLLAGVPPFVAPTVDGVFAAILESRPPVDRVPPALAAVIACALARDPAARFQDVRALATTLTSRRSRPRRRLRWIIPAVGAAAVASTALAVTAPWSSSEPDGSRYRVVEGITFTIQIPNGWSVATPMWRDATGVTPDAILLMPDHPSKGKIRSSVIASPVEPDPDELAAVFEATPAYCIDLGGQISQTTDADVLSAKPTAFGEFRGCDVDVRKRNGQFALRSFALGNGKVNVEIACSRDKTGDLAVDAACLATALTLRPR